MTSLGTVISDRLSRDSGETECGRGCGCECEPSFEGDTLRIDASACEHDGSLASSPGCRSTVVGALAERDVETVVIRTSGVESRYVDAACAVLVAAGRFVEAVRDLDSRLAALARRDPLAAAREATGRADGVSDIAAEVGLAELAAGTGGYESVLAPVVGLVVSDWRVDTTYPTDARLTDTRELDTGGSVRQYVSDDGRDRYVLEPLEHGLNPAETGVLAAAYERLAEGRVSGGDRAPGRAVRDVAPQGVSTQTVSRVLYKHTRGYGLLADLVVDPAVSDVFVTAPVSANPVRVRIDGGTVPTNVRLTDGGIDALASRLRHESGRGFSRADPTLDASVTVGGRRVRVAGVTDPASDGTGFAFRAHDRDVRTLPGLVANDTLTAGVAALLSVAVERGRSLLIAGPRSAGKTTLLGALLWEIPPAVRMVLIEDTPELPAGPLQDAGRDVQTLRTGNGRADFDPTTALRTALRLGDGALVLGEVRGEEARVLYEAMRVGANSEAVLGTIHGDGAGDTYERIVSDLGVPSSSFCATDLVVTVEIAKRATQSRRVRAIDEVRDWDGDWDGDGDREDPVFERLYHRPDGPLEATGIIDRANSHLVASLATPDETYADVREALATRTSRLADLAATGRTAPDAVAAGVAAGVGWRG